MIKKSLHTLIFLPFTLFAQEKEIKTANYFEDLTPKERNIIIEKGTERAWSGDYLTNTAKGTYVCKACNNPLFNSDSKFKSNCGWPSFDDEIDEAITRKQDYSLGMKRIEICCSNCKGHLGHIFEGEGLTDKNIRHCVNSLSILFIPKK